MTIEQKRQTIANFCNAQVSCETCPINKIEFCDNHTEENAPEEILDAWCQVIMDYEMEGAIPEANEVEQTASKIIDNHDNVNHPSHYESGSVECIEAMIETQGVEAVKSFCVCNAFKYLWRHNNKNALEDIKKARWYLNKFIELEEKTNGLERV